MKTGVNVAELDKGKSTRQLYDERVARTEAAWHNQPTDRIPIRLSTGSMGPEYAGVTRLEWLNDLDLADRTLRDMAMRWQPDIFAGWFATSEPSRILGDRLTKWPGYGLGPNQSYQFAEYENMKAEDYPALIEDPADFAIRTFIPRAYESLEAFADLPHLGLGFHGTLGAVRLFASPKMRKAVQALLDAGVASEKFGIRFKAHLDGLKELGFAPDMPGFGVGAPFDLLADSLRGMRGSMLDLFRRPDDIIEAEKKLLRLEKIEAKRAADAGVTKAFIATHRGSDGFMSLKQFEKFYWPQLKELVWYLAELGMTTRIVWEGVWDQRLEYLNEMPRHMTVGQFQASDIWRVKEVCGDNLCILGGLPISMLHNEGDPVKLREFTHELCERLGPGGGFVMAPSIGELEGCDPALVDVWINATKEFGVY
jgi:hypothetical protein